MFKIGGIILCFSYIVGLLFTGIFSSPVHGFLRQQWAGFFIFITIATILVTVFLPRFWHFSPQRIWLFSSGVIVLFAIVYFHLRLPHQSFNDVSYQLSKFEDNFSPLVQVTGEVITNPKLTRKNKIKFVLKAKSFNLSSQTTEKVTGKLYVTVPLLQATGLYPSQKVTLTGKLYQPSTVVNPGGFDFQAYLFRQGIFAGFTANELKINQEGNALDWGLWQLRNRIIRTHLRYLKVPLGNTLSSIVLGGRAVDLPYEIQDLFIRIGLIHVLSVSGFHVSLWLGSILFLSKHFSQKIQLIIGFFSLLIYPLFTGFYPSVLRASLMGFAVLIGMISDRRVNSFGSLLLAATILLLINPLWIWDLGFQLSFLATLGLISLLPAITTRLDWLPPNLAGLIAVPLAASIWVLPLQCYTFYTIPLYGVIVNMIVTPLVIIISLGGMISALMGIFFPLGGSAIAFLLSYPLLILIKIGEIFAILPGSFFATGKISLAALLFCYFLFIAIWLIPWCQKHWQLVSLFLLMAVIIPIVINKINLNQVTVLATNKEPIMIIQNQGKITLINPEDRDTFEYNLLPFLAHQGINKIDSLILFNANQESRDNWLLNFQNISTSKVFLTANSNKDNLQLDKNSSISDNQIKLISQKPPILDLEIFSKNWLLLLEKLPQQVNINLKNLKTDILLWSGVDFNSDWLNTLKPQVAIAFKYAISPTLKRQLEKHQIKVYSTKNDGAIQYQPKRGFQSYIPEYDIITE
jgi:competence protein ComEC